MKSTLVDGVSGTPTVREHLIATLAAAVGTDHAVNVVEALDEYLAVDVNDRVPAHFFPHVDPAAELEGLRAERDAAVKRAEAAERQLKTKQVRRKRK